MMIDGRQSKRLLGLSLAGVSQEMAKLGVSIKAGSELSFYADQRGNARAKSPENL